MPFTIGDRVELIDPPYRNHPAATVTELTARGFRYELERAAHMGYGLDKLGECIGGATENPERWRLVTH